MYTNAQIKTNNRTIIYTYGLLVINLLITAFAAMWGYQQLVEHKAPWVLQIINHPWILTIGLIVVSIIFRLCATTVPVIALPLLILVSVAIGLSMSTIGLIYPITVMKNAVIATSILCVVLTLLSFQSKIDMSKFSGQLTGLLIAVVIISLINVFWLHSSMLSLIISIISTVVFGIWLMIDTQRVFNDNSNNAFTTSLILAYSIYLDVINLFMNLLKIIDFFTNNR